MERRLLPLLPFYGMLLVLIGATVWQAEYNRHHGPYRHREPFVYNRLRRFKLRSIPVPNQCRIFRFTDPEIKLLAQLLWLDSIEWSYRNKPSSVTALCVVLARLAYPNRWIRSCGMFGRS
jgi:hypothetical protein